MATGRESVRYLTELVQSHAMSLDGRVLDFGCGVGRMSNALAEQGLQVVGVDIAASMAERAKELNAHSDSLSFVTYAGGELPFPDNSLRRGGHADRVAALPATSAGGRAPAATARRPARRVLIFQIPSRPVPSRSSTYELAVPTSNGCPS
jgi:SAM-dependent methyltransferase